MHEICWAMNWEKNIFLTWTSVTMGTIGTSIILSMWTLFVMSMNQKLCKIMLYANLPMTKPFIKYHIAKVSEWELERMWFLTTSPVCAAGYVRKRWWQMYFIGKCFVHLNRNCINRSSFKTFSRNGFQGVAASILSILFCSCFHTFCAHPVLGKVLTNCFFLLAFFCGRFLRNCRVKNNNWLSANRKLSSKQARNLSQVESSSVIVAEW